MSDKLSWKKSLLVRSEILGLFFNTLTAYHMYFRQNWGKVPEQVKIQSPSIPWTIPENFFALLKST